MQLSQHVQCQLKPSLLGLLICAGALYSKTAYADMGKWIQHSCIYLELLCTFCHAADLLTSAHPAESLPHMSNVYQPGTVSYPSSTLSPVTADVQEPAQTEPSDPPTPIYITPLPPGYLATLPTDQQQSHWDAINALQHPQTSFSNGASDLSGKYITPMPPQDVLNNLPTRNQQPSRDKGKPGGQGGQRGKGKGSKAGKGQKQGGHPGEAKNGGNQRSSAEKNGDSQDDAPQPQRKQNKRNNRAKGRNNNG